MWNVILMISVTVALILVWIMVYDSNRFVVRTHHFADARIQKSCKAVLLADLHNKRYGRKNEYLIRGIRREKPDMILIAGDLLTAHPGETLDVAVDLLEELARDYPVYYGIGNHEYRMELYPDKYGDMCVRYREALQKIGIRMMDNEKREVGETGLVVFGLNIDRQFYKRFRAPVMETAYLESVLGSAEEGKYNVLLAHNPDYFPQYAAWGADLTLAGHLHGGIARVPFWGKGALSPKLRFFPRYDGGLFTADDGRKMLVSRGLGMHTIPVRLFNPGELCVLYFDRAE